MMNDRYFWLGNARRAGVGLAALALGLQVGSAHAQTAPSPVSTVAPSTAAAPADPEDPPKEKETPAAPQADNGGIEVQLKRFKQMSSALDAVCKPQNANEVARDIGRLPSIVELAKKNAKENEASDAKNKARVAKDAAAKARAKADDAKKKEGLAEQQRAAGPEAAARADAAKKAAADEEGKAKQAEKDAKAVADAVKPETPEALSATVQGQLAGGTCSTFCPSGGLSFCGLPEPVLAAMLLAAPDEVTALQEAVKASLPPEAEKRTDGKVTSSFERLQASLPNGITNTSAVGDLPVLAANVLQGLGKLIVDRGKTEAVGWLLDRMGKELCGLEGARTTEQWEISKYWLPNVCALAAEKRLSSYGGGGAMLANLKRAVEMDLRLWPGTLPSFAPAALYLEDAGPASVAADRPDSVIACSVPEEAKSKALCKPVTALRLATRDRVNEILTGRNALDALYDLSLELEEANAPVSSLRVRSMACGLGVPHEFHAHDSALKTVLNRAPRAHAAALASAITHPACYAQVKPSNYAFPLFDKLSTILALQAAVGKEAAGLGTKTSAFLSALDELSRAKAALDAQVAAGEDGEAQAPKVDEDADPTAVFNATLAFKSGLLEGKLSPARLRLAQAALAAADAALVLSQGSLRTIAGACVVGGAASCKARMLEAATQLQEIRNWFAVASVATTGDIGKTSIALLAAVQGADSKAQIPRTRALLLQHIGVLAAIATAQDSDGIARALDQAASPVGGWRAKGVKGATTVSLTAHPGMFAGAELRNGTYGATDENWKSHGQAPTLALPLGLEIAWGGCDDAECVSPVGLYFPLLDPVAFLQYDAEKDGRLPGASFKTVLSPGFGLRLGVPETPFSFIPLVVYRPGFRQWKADFNGTGADALQLGVLVSVDVTLLELSHTEKK